MENERLPRISVIIVAYNRKEFLTNAIKSALNQTLDKKYYEIIVIKNFLDDSIDNFILENNIKGIISKENSLGGKLIEALNIATGTIISFLEDDDLFSNNKLEIVNNKFTKIRNLCYYHNDNIPVSKDYNRKDMTQNKEIWFNLSSISIEKHIINVNNILKENFSMDHFMYIQALESNKKIIKGKEKLTYYMEHQGSSSELITNNLNQFVSESILRNKKMLRIILEFRKTCSSKKAISYINAVVASYKLTLYFYGISERPNDILKYFFYSPSFYKFKVIIAYILVRLNKNFRTNFIYRSFRYFQNSVDK